MGTNIIPSCLKVEERGVGKLGGRFAVLLELKGVEFVIFGNNCKICWIEGWKECWIWVVGGFEFRGGTTTTK